jgi:hypothetical protein
VAPSISATAANARIEGIYNCAVVTAKPGPRLSTRNVCITTTLSEGEGLGSLCCRDCGLQKEISQFRQRRAEGPEKVHQCRDCHALAERLRRRAKRARETRKEANHQLAQLKRAKSDLQVVAVCDAMVRGFGGINGFQRAWAGVLDRDLQKGGFAALRHIEAVIRLVQYCEANKPNYKQMTDEQLLDLAASLQQI